jgi:hypothetical protein
MLAVTQIIKSKSFTSLIENGLGAILGVVILASFLSDDFSCPYLILLAIYGVFETLRIGNLHSIDFYIQQPSIQIINNN